MTTMIIETRPRFAAYLDTDGDLVVTDRLHGCETGFAYYTLADAERICEHIAQQGCDYFLCDEPGTFEMDEEAEYRLAVGPHVFEAPARFTAVPVLVEGKAGFAVRDHRAGLEAFFISTSVSDAAMALETSQATINERLNHAREQFLGQTSFLGVPIGTHLTTGPEFLVTPSHELES